MILKRIKGYREYLIAESGDITSYKKGYKPRVMKTYISNSGYYSLRLCKNGVSKLFTMHRLKATAFIPNPNNYPCINHKDGNKLNNDLPNLEWCDYSHNNRHAYRSGLKKPVGLKLNTLQVSVIKRLLNDMSDVGISKYFPVTRRTINNIRFNILHSSHNFGAWKANSI